MLRLEFDMTNNFLMNYTFPLIINGSVVIRPLYCSEIQSIGSIGTLTAKCYNQNEKPVIFLKNEEIRIIINGNLTVKDIILNGIDDIAKFNSYSFDLIYCLSNPVICCQENDLISSIKNLDCKKNNLVVDNISNQTNTVFLIRGKDEGSFFQLLNFELRFTNLLKTNTFFQLENLGSVEIRDTSFISSFLNSGLFYFNSSLRTANVRISNLFINNYNPYNFQSNSTEEKGILMTDPFHSIFSLEITNSNFMNVNIPSSKQLILTKSNTLNFTNSFFQNISVVGKSDLIKAQFYKNYNSTVIFANLTFIHLNIIHGELFNNDVKELLELRSLKIRSSWIGIDSVLIIAINARIVHLEITDSDFNDYSSQATIIQQNNFYSLPGIVLSDLNISLNRFANTNTLLYLKSHISISNLIFNSNIFNPFDKATIIILSLDVDDVVQAITFYNNTITNSYENITILIEVSFCESCIIKNINLSRNHFDGNFIGLDMQLAENLTLYNLNLKQNDFKNQNDKTIMLLIAGINQFYDVNIESNYLPSAVAMIKALPNSISTINNITIYNNSLIDSIYNELKNKTLLEVGSLATLNMTDSKILKNDLSRCMTLLYSNVHSSVKIENSIISENEILTDAKIPIFISMFAFEKKSNVTLKNVNFIKNTQDSKFTFYFGEGSNLAFENINIFENTFKATKSASGFFFAVSYAESSVLKKIFIEKNTIFSENDYLYSFLDSDLDINYLFMSNITFNENLIKGYFKFIARNFLGKIIDVQMLSNKIKGYFYFVESKGFFDEVFFENFLFGQNNITCETCSFFLLESLYAYFWNFTFTQNRINILGTTSTLLDFQQNALGYLDITLSHNSLAGIIKLVNLEGLLAEGKINLRSNSIISPAATEVLIFVSNMIFDDIELHAYNNTIISESYQTGILRLKGWTYFTGLTLLNFSNNYMEGESTIMVIVGNYLTFDWEFKAYNNIIVNSRMFFAFNYGLKNLHLFNNTIFSNKGRMRSFIDSYIEVEVHSSIIENNTLYGDAIMINQADLCNAHDLVIINNKFFDKSGLLGGRIVLKNIMFENNELHDDTILLQGESSFSITIENVTFKDFIFTSQSTLITNFDNVFTISQSNFNNLVSNSKKSNFLISLAKTMFQIANLTFANSSFILEITDSSGTIGDIGIYYTRGLSPDVKSAIDLTSSSVNISNMKIFGDPNVTEKRFNLLIFRGGNVEIENLEFYDMVSAIGNQIQLFSNSKVTINSFICYNVYAKDGSPLINSKVSESLSMESLDFAKTNSVLTSVSTNTIEVNDILFDSDLIFPLINIRNSKYIILKDIKISKKNFKTKIESVINIIEPQIQLLFEHVYISDFETLKGSIFIFSSLNSIAAFFKHLRLENNTIYGSGAALAIELAKNSSLSFNECELNYNKAYATDKIGGKGGAIYVYSTFDDPKIRSSFIVSNSKFARNFAELNGGAIFSNGIIPDIDSATDFQENKIRINITNHVSTQAVRVVTVNESVNFRSNQIKLENIPSGIAYSKRIFLELLDYYNQTSYDDSISIITLVEDATSSLKLSKTTFQAEFGRYIIQDTIFTESPNVNSHFQFKSSGIRQFSSFNITEEDYLIRFAVTFRNCSEGEILLDSGECYFCPDGYASFSLEINTKVPCTQCDSTKMICPGGSVVQELPGYWKLNSSSDVFNPCDFQAACMGDLNLLTINLTNRNDLNSTCSEEYTGNLCSTCALGYGKNFRGSKCSECTDLTGFVLITIFVLVWNVYYIALSVHYQHKQNKIEDSDPEAQMKNKRLGSLFKNLTDYIQMISLFGTIPTSLPDSYREGALVTNQVIIINSNSFNSECFYQESVSGEDRIFVKTMIANLTPFILLALLTILWLIIAFIKRKDPEFKLKTNMAVTLIILIYTQQIQIIQANLELFNCQNLYRKDNPISFLRTNPDTECWTEKHYYWLLIMTIPVLVTWALFIPLKFLYLLWTHRKNLSDKKIRTYYSYTYRGYKQEKYFWEFIVMLRKYIIIILAVFGKIYSTKFQIYMILYVIGLAYYLQQRFQPYIQENLNWIEKISLISASFVILSSSYFTFIPKSSILVDYFFVILINVSFFGYISLYIRIFIPTLKEKIIASKLFKKLKNFFKKISNRCRKRKDQGEDQEKNEYIDGEVSIDLKESELISLKVFDQTLLSESSNKVELPKELSQDQEHENTIVNLNMIDGVDLDSERIEINTVNKKDEEDEIIVLDGLEEFKLKSLDNSYEIRSQELQDRTKDDPQNESHDEIKNISKDGEDINEQPDVINEDLQNKLVHEIKSIGESEENEENEVGNNDEDIIKKLLEGKNDLMRNPIRDKTYTKKELNKEMLEMDVKDESNNEST